MVKVLETINLTYKDFNNVNLSFEGDTYYSIIGSNNSGKTTLFRLLTGIIPTTDVIFCNKVNLNKENNYEYIVNLGVVDRVNKESFIYNSVVNEMYYPLHNLGFSKRKSLERINYVLDTFNATKLLDKKISELDYYDKELLLIMIALLHKPKVLLLDSVLEIFPKSTKETIIKNIKKVVNNITIISFTNSLEEAYESDRIIILNNKEIMGEYLPSDIFKDDKLFYENNLEIPFLVDLSVKLKMYNLVDKEYKNMKAMVDDLWP